MKQVFPGIRPRRLGTRGHSRYCYAAMRKATKLEPPRVPDINIKLNSSSTNYDCHDNNTDDNDDSWRIVKNWAEGLLKTSFLSINDLANHITKHLKLAAVNGSGGRGGDSGNCGSSSKQNLNKKKNLQNDFKDRKKLVSFY